MFRKANPPATTESKSSFWKDEVDLQQYNQGLPKSFLRFFRYYGIAVILLSYLALFILFFQISSYFAIGFFIFLTLLYGFAVPRGFIIRNKVKIENKEISQIQQRAREKAKAVLMGSAIHVAGNPKLKRDQGIVLALTADSLDFYASDHDTPLDSIPLKQIMSVSTVVYDDERTPHLDAVDSAAQALQLSVRYGDNTYNCLIRSMRKVRPVDWYHAIQKRRIQATGYNNPINFN